MTDYSLQWTAGCRVFSVLHTATARLKSPTSTLWEPTGPLLCSPEFSAMFRDSLEEVPNEVEDIFANPRPVIPLVQGHLSFILVERSLAIKTMPCNKNNQKTILKFFWKGTHFVVFTGIIMAQQVSLFSLLKNFTSPPPPTHTHHWASWLRALASLASLCFSPHLSCVWSWLG